MADIERDYEKGPNGFPYVDAEKMKLGGWESGDYRFELVREDGETLIANLTPEQMAGFVEMAQDVHDRHEAAMQEAREDE
ncbi:hypothetical protein [Halarchaeum sp. P4]|uniref:hypothetical protein n=1 Tax=Halarchaeum sp. P4 TaxID=3421639 RepID=UPI003EB75338